MPAPVPTMRATISAMEASSTQEAKNYVLRKKWGRALDYAGFQAIPNLLLTRQRALNLSSTDLVVLLHINRCWWRHDRDPFPRPARIAAQMGVHRRTVERCLRRLEEKGLLKRLEPRRTDSGRVVWPISLTPLAVSLEQIAEILASRAAKDES
ncbi:MAG: helix-turn-helix domain-containing protein [Acidobacteriia bacterium]|nr:helix-turn-helix domain-containing protein [Terriglobia bacterium]MYG04001.1 helix-turn-helix domain-containing protein [Terriglobia bacterium]MYK08417.1 helix-turn-helix domain-containing protein [Terriglobia bacterium]